MALGSINELWRYPVKSMQGERLDRADVTDRGVLGDRAFALIDRSDGRVASAKQPMKWGTPLAHWRWLNPSPYRGVEEPVGWLHLERLEMTPFGVEHGELVHSVPLTPKETVNITHRERTITTHTFESLIQDSLEGFSETGVTEKTDLAQATDTESKHSSALDVNGAMSATYNGGSYSVTQLRQIMMRHIHTLGPAR